ncbi:hypothetical protein EJB05_30965 [Eragrostis curvula]|uniref:Uncharacterized protein n=1 Tax=Eragrostis curvula TaxID=38414 RepID=A0A5J9UDB0_9POAL|nr:hypothetical protein EJB05_30965 [Eragrostis curvula]
MIEVLLVASSPLSSLIVPAACCCCHPAEPSCSQQLAHIQQIGLLIWQFSCSACACSLYGFLGSHNHDPVPESLHNLRPAEGRQETAATKLSNGAARRRREGQAARGGDGVRLRGRPGHVVHARPGKDSGDQRQLVTGDNHLFMLSMDGYGDME